MTDFTGYTTNLKSQQTGLEIAVIGMSGRFPGAKNVEQFWENIKNGIESIGFFSDEELLESGVEPGLLKNNNYVKAKGLLEAIEYFDAHFFDYLPQYAVHIDPQVRIFHECVWEALENAGYTPDEYEGLIGIFAGSSFNLEWINRLYGIRDIPLLHEVLSLNQREYLTTRISYKFNLRGPSVTVNTACSTSLVAVHMACQGLLNGECNVALAGGVTINFPQISGYMFQEGMILSPDGHCRAFDANALGTTFSSGAGIVVLKPLEDAVADGDTIYAVIKGSAVNNDGAQKVGFTAPAVNGQSDVIKAALYTADVEPTSLSYLETHGTGTSVGDSIEIEALIRAFNTKDKGFCRIGSVKTNVGHLETAAGVAGLIKTVLSLKHKIIPPSLHFQSSHPEIHLKNTPFSVNTGLTSWDTNRLPRRAGVSSFGIGGTNVHVVLEEWPEQPKQTQGREYQLIVLSAKTEHSLQKAAEHLGKFLKKNPGINLSDASYTLQVGRKHFEHRLIFVCVSPDEAVEILSSPHSEKLFTARATETKPRIIFMFSGQGSQYVNMGSELYRSERVFREEMDRCFEILKPLTGYDIKEILYPPGVRCSQPEARPQQVNQTEIAQPLLFIFEYALGMLLLKWGIKPHAMIGHSVGEYTAAYLSGVLSLEDALKLVVLRGKLMQAMSTGSMVSVPLTEQELKPLMVKNLDLAAVNAPGRCVVSGPNELVETFAAQMKEKGHDIQMIHTSHAFHSLMMDPMLKEFENNVRQATLNQPTIPYISNVTGTWITSEQVRDPRYWADHVRQTVRFSDGIRTLLKKGNSIFIEIGPGKALTTLTRQHTNQDKPSEIPVHTLNLVRHPKENVSDSYFLLDKIGRLWLWGLQVNWHEFHARENEKKYRIPLPTYPFDYQKYEIKHNQSETKRNLTIKERDTDDLKRQQIDQWFYIPSWKRMDLPKSRDGDGIPTRCRLVFRDECGVGLKLIERLKENHGPIVVVKPAKSFKKTGNEKSGLSTITINPRKPEHYERLFNHLSQRNIVPEEIVHCWGITPDNPGLASMEQVEKTLDLVFYSLLNIVHAHAAESVKAGNLDRATDKKLQVTTISNHLQEVKGTEEIHPEKAAILGAVGVIPKEYPYIHCRAIDIILPSTDTPEEELLLHQLMVELTVASPGTSVAFRDQHRWIQTFEPVSLAKPGKELPFLRDKGVYLVTGGFGGIGFVLARSLAKTMSARIIIINRSTSTPYEKQKIEELENLGAEVLVYSADVSQQKPMEEAFRQALERFGTIHGIIHAAGIADYAGVIPRRSREQSEAVLAPKVKGTLVLKKLLTKMNLKPDFFMLCSSLTSITTPLGQVAYAAANAFLDAFAHQQQINPDQYTFTVSINWDSWQEVGMAVKAVEKLTASRELTGYQHRPVNHPLFDQRLTARSGDEEIFISYLRVDKHWVIDEHRILENPALPGVAYLEILKAAFEHFTNIQENEHMDNGMMEIRNLTFSQPLMVPEQEEKEVRTILGKEAEGFRFRVISRRFPGKEEWQEHASGTLFSLPAAPPITHQTKEIEEKCGGNWITREKAKEIGNPTPSTHLLWFGPRWQNIKAEMTAGNQGLAQLELPTEFNQDLQSYRLHPALLDIATSFLVKQIQMDQYYLPFTYKRIRTGVHTHLPGKIYSHAVLVNGEKHEPASHKKTLEFNVTIMDESGMELMAIEGFILLSLPTDISIFSKSGRFNIQTFSTPLKEEKQPEKDQLRDAIRPEEGIEVVKQILYNSYPQVLVSTKNFNCLLERSREFQLPGIQEEPAEEKAKAPTRPRPALSNPYLSPTNTTEQHLADIWQKFFAIQQVGILDDFFELGGDSLKAMNVVSQIHRELEVEVPITEFFTRPIIKKLAEYINNTRKSKFFEIQPTEKKEYYPLSPAQKRMYIIYQLDPDSTAYNLSFSASLDLDVDKEKMEKVFKKLIQRHENLRTSIEMIKGEPFQRVNQKVTFSMEYHEDGSINVGDFTGNFVRPFDLSKGPLVRVGLIKIEDQYLLMLDAHHIMMDEYSRSTFIKDFLSFYNSGELNPLKLQYKDYSQWLVGEEKRADIGKQKEYWLKEFADGVPVLNLPTDSPRPEIQSFVGRSVSQAIEIDEIQKLKELAVDGGVTLSTVILTIVYILLAKISGDDDIVVGIPVLGRRHVDLEGIIGMFINTLAFRNYPRGEKTYRDFLLEVNARMLEAFDNQEYSFNELVEEVLTRRDPSRNPLYDVMFVYNPQLDLEVGDAIKVVPPSKKMRENYNAKNLDSQNDITLHIGEGRDSFMYKMAYCSDLFKEETIRRFLDYLHEIQLQVIKNKDIQLQDIKISHDLITSESGISEEDQEDFGF